MTATCSFIPVTMTGVLQPRSPVSLNVNLTVENPAAVWEGGYALHSNGDETLFVFDLDGDVAKFPRLMFSFDAAAIEGKDPPQSEVEITYDGPPSKTKKTHSGTLSFTAEITPANASAHSLKFRVKSTNPPGSSQYFVYGLRVSVPPSLPFGRL